MRTAINIRFSLRHIVWLSLLLVSLAGTAPAQSLDISYPSPIRANEVSGTIGARDLGDARLTDHFYTFAGTPGDLILTIESSNLNGDIDVFAAVGLRPLLKFTVYAESSTPITKSIFLRRRADLILRVEARTPNDEAGTYRLRFSGSFEPVAGEPLVAENENREPNAPVANSSSIDKNVRRVSSVGARLAEPTPSPVTEIAAQPTPEPSPTEATSAMTPEKSVPGKPSKPATRSAGSSKSSTRKSATASNATTDAAINEPETGKTEVPESKPTPARRRSAGRVAKQPPPSARVVEPPAEPESGPRLLIETRNGTFIDRFMSTVRRVMIENGQVIVVGNDNKVDRIKLVDVVKMEISP